MKQLFSKTINEFSAFFRGCDGSFVNRVIVSLSYKSFEDGQLIQSANDPCTDIYFVKKGGVAVCETTFFHEPILIYGKGAVFNVYQVLMKTQLEFDFRAKSKDHIEVIELMKLPREIFLQTCESFPKSTELV